MSGRRSILLAFLTVGMVVPAVLLWLRAASSSQNAWAVSLTDNSLVSTSCTPATLTPFMGSLTVNIIVPVISKALDIGTNVCTATSDVPDGVNGEVSVSVVGCVKEGLNSVSVNTYPTTAKLAGYTCNSVLPAELRLAGDGVDNAVIDITVQALGDTTFNLASRIDLNTSGRVIYGTGGLVSATKITNGGFGDQDGLADNEIVNLGDVGSGGPVVRIFLRVKVFDFDVGGNTEEGVRVRYVI